MMGILTEAKKRIEKNSCKGRYYRGRKNTFVSKKGEYYYIEKMIPLKKLSCVGCEHCDYLDDELNEFTSSGYLLPTINNIEDGGLYKLELVNVSTDFETGYVDDYELEFVKIMEKQI